MSSKEMQLIRAGFKFHSNHAGPPTRDNRMKAVVSQLITKGLECASMKTINGYALYTR